MLRPKEWDILARIKRALESCAEHVEGEAGEEYDHGGPEVEREESPGKFDFV